MTFSLRPYQRAAVDACWEYFKRGGRNPLIEVPTGGGKSAILGQIAREVVEKDSRVLIATHRRELIKQDAAACRNVWPEANVGIYSAGLGQRQIRKITVAGVQSIRKRAAEMGFVDLLVIDEAHLLNPTADTSYRMLIDGLREINSDLCILGLTATPYRLGQGMLTHGKDRIFDSIAYRVPMRDLIRDGFLAPLVSGNATASINLDDVRTQAGEFAAKDLELAADVDSINEAVAADVAGLLAAGRTSALLFGVSVAHATRMCWALRTLGVSCEVVVGETPNRDRILEDFKARRLQAIASCDVLTTGFDAPVIDVLALVRPTKSTSLYVQMVGRGSRMSKGKTDCVILDFGGNIARHGPADDVKPPKPKGEGKGEAPTKECPECCAEVPAAARECPECGFAFPEIVRKANKEASKLAVLSSTVKADPRKTVNIGHVRWEKHIKRSAGPNDKPSLHITYFAAEGRKTYNDYVCLEHDETNFAWRRAVEWWNANVGCARPDTVDAALALLDDGHMAKVTSIVVEPDGEFWRVLKVLQERPREPGFDDDVFVPAAVEVDDVDLPF